MASIHAAFKWQSTFDRIVLLTGDTLSCLLQGPGSHTLQVIPEVEGPICGLIPIAGPVECVSTSGFKWNLSDQRMEWGVLVSTSNEIDVAPGDAVHVNTSQSLLWTCSLAKGGYLSK